MKTEISQSGKNGERREGRIKRLNFLRGMNFNFKETKKALTVFIKIKA